MEKVIPTMIENKLIPWVIDLLKKSMISKVHIFCLDFSSALLANIIHSPTTLSFLEHNQDLAKKYLSDLLHLMK